MVHNNQIDLPPMQAPKENLSILYAEDSIVEFNFYRTVITESLKDTHNVTISHFQTLADLAIHLNNDESYDVIVLDLNLLDSSGIKTLEAVKEICKFTAPIIIISGLDDVTTKSECIKAGADKFVVKGIHDRNLIGIILSFNFDQKKMEANLKYLG